MSINRIYQLLPLWNGSQCLSLFNLSITGKHTSASDIVARFGGQVRLSAVQVGKALQEMGIEQYRSHYGRFWKLFERPASDIGHMVPEDVNLPKEDLPF